MKVVRTVTEMGISDLLVLRDDEAAILRQAAEIERRSRELFLALGSTADREHEFGIRGTTRLLGSARWELIREPKEALMRAEWTDRVGHGVVLDIKDSSVPIEGRLLRVEGDTLVVQGRVVGTERKVDIEDVAGWPCARLVEP